MIWLFPFFSESSWFRKTEQSLILPCECDLSACVVLPEMQRPRSCDFVRGHQRALLQLPCFSPVAADALLGASSAERRLLFSFWMKFVQHLYQQYCVSLKSPLWWASALQIRPGYISVLKCKKEERQILHTPTFGLFI